MPLKPALKYILLLCASVLLTMMTVVFGGAPMRATRLIYGRAAYWAGFILISATLAALGLPAYALLVISLAVAVGVYTEVEEHGGAVFSSGFVGIITALGATALIGGMWMHRNQIKLLNEIRSMIATFESGVMAGSSSAPGAAAINADSIIQQLPSIAIIGLVLALGISLISQSRVLTWLGASAVKKPVSDLSQFRVPDIFVWLAIAAIFGAFFQHGNKPAELISINALNVLSIIFFFQGLAVVSQAFSKFKVAPFWQGLWYIVLVLQLFLVVSLVGLADFWLEFRERLARKPATTNKSF